MASSGYAGLPTGGAAAGTAKGDGDGGGVTVSGPALHDATIAQAMTNAISASRRFSPPISFDPLKLELVADSTLGHQAVESEFHPVGMVDGTSRCSREGRVGLRLRAETKWPTDSSRKWAPGPG